MMHFYDCNCPNNNSEKKNDLCFVQTSLHLHSVGPTLKLHQVQSTKSDWLHNAMYKNTVQSRKTQCNIRIRIFCHTSVAQNRISTKKK